MRPTAARGGGAVRTADSFGHLADGEEAVDLEDGDGAGRDLRHLEVEQVGRLELPSAVRRLGALLQFLHSVWRLLSISAMLLNY